MLFFLGIFFIVISAVKFWTGRFNNIRGTVARILFDPFYEFLLLEEYHFTSWFEMRNFTTACKFVKKALRYVEIKADFLCIQNILRREECFFYKLDTLQDNLKLQFFDQDLQRLNTF